MYVDRHIKYQTRVMPIPFRNQKLKRQYQTTKITKYKRFYFKWRKKYNVFLHLWLKWPKSCQMMIVYWTSYVHPTAIWNCIMHNRYLNLTLLHLHCLLYCYVIEKKEGDQGITLGRQLIRIKDTAHFAQRSNHVFCL